jgi:hypothetical protein
MAPRIKMPIFDCSHFNRLTSLRLASADTLGGQTVVGANPQMCVQDFNT